MIKRELKIVRSIIVTLMLMLHSFLFYSQPVIFNPTTDLLNPIGGFTDYADCVVDMNGDFLDDVVRVGGKGVFIDYQQKDGSYLQKQFHFPVQSLPSWSICAGDIDNNGYNDLLFAHSSSVSFVLANENATDYGEYLMPGLVESQRSTMVDINNDGWLDAFVCHESEHSKPFRNLGYGIMIPDTNLIHTANLPGNYAALWTDYDNDADVDLYISKCWEGALPGDIVRTNLLYRNNNDETFTETGAQAGIDDNAQSWSTSFDDFDNDGDFDAFVVNHDFANRLYRNNGDGTFTDVIFDSGIDPFDLLAFENATGDFNNDGFIDIFAELTYRFYLGHGDLTFTGQEALMKPGAIGDLNNDGFLDIMDEKQLWLNEGNQNHWLKVNTLGLVSNRNGIGARIEIYGDWGKKIREVRSGQSYSPMNSLTTHFGLGLDDRIDSLIVRWPSGMITKWFDLVSDTTYFIPESSCILDSISLNVSDQIDLCHGDSIILQAPSGFTGYLWSNGDTNQVIVLKKEGVYFLTAKDSSDCVGISKLVKVILILDSPPTISNGSGTRFCEGDTILLTSSPGTNYNWSNGEKLKQSIEVTQSGLYTVSVDAICENGQITSEPIQVVLLPAPPPEVYDVFLLPGDSVQLEAIGENIQWYDQPIGGTILATGSSYQTSALQSSAIFYTESHHSYPGEFQSGGKPDNTGPGGLPLQDGYLIFENREPFILLSVTVYVPLEGPSGVRFIQLISNGNVIESKQFTVQKGMNVLELNFEVPVGTHYLTCPQGNLYRNTSPLNYPYAIGNVGHITSSSNGDGYYYYFFDWKISTYDIECTSERVPVNVIVSSDEFIGHHPVFRIYPNPIDDELFIEFNNDSSPIDLIVVDLFGKRIYSESLHGQKDIRLSMQKYVPGIYFIQFISDDLAYSQKIIIQ